MMKKRYSPFRPKITNESRALVKVTFHLPPSVESALKSQSHLKGMTISELASLALDNELQAANAFELPSIEGIPHTGDDLPQNYKLYDFIKAHPGLTLTYLVTLRREIGIEKVEDLLIAHRTLLRKDLIETYSTRASKIVYKSKFTQVGVLK